MTDPRPEDALAHAAAELRRRGKRFALVGGLAISVVKRRLALIAPCGFALSEDLASKLDALLARRVVLS
jgi:hypothetical protein